MITEIAVIEIKLGAERDYEAAMLKAKDLPPIPGFHGFELHRSIESPHGYRFMARWDSVADHNAFRASPAFAEWRSLVGPYYAGTPDVEHTETIVSTF